MGWLGKFFGAGIGFTLGGPLGALAGATIGHGVDHFLSQPARSMRRPERRSTGREYEPRPKPRGASSGFPQGGYFYATFAVMGHLAKADGRVSPQEIALAEAEMTRLQLSAGERRLAITYFNEGKGPEFALDSVLDALKRECRGRTVLLRPFLEMQFQMAYAEGSIQPDQLRLLMHIATRLGLAAEIKASLDALAKARPDPSGQRQGRRRGGPSRPHADPGWRAGAQPGRDTRAALASAYAVLRISSTASAAEVKRAYRRLLSQHHPDKLVSQGASPEMLKLADEKTHEIRAAYETITRARAA